MKKATLFFAASAILILTLALKPINEQSSAKVEPGLFKVMEVTYLWGLLQANYEPNWEQDNTWLDVGFRSKYAMVKKYASLEMVEAAFGVPVFAKGPHTDGMNFNSNNSFGHYNPNFIAKVESTFNAAMKNPIYRKAIKEVYKKYLASMANTYRDSYQYLNDKPEYLVELQDRYKAMLATSEGNNNGSFQEEFRDFAENLEKTKGANVYEAFTAPAFWMRRSIDGSGKEMYKLLDTMMKKLEKVKKIQKVKTKKPKKLRKY